jgi:dihydrofolate reductase
MSISLIAAIDENGIIGNNNQMLWHVPRDMAHFKKITIGKTVIMGRKTYDSLKKPLSDRRNLVLTHNKLLTIPNCGVFYSVPEILHSLDDSKENIVIGGASTYRLFLPLADKIYLTIIHAIFAGDKNFPEFDRKEWQELEHISYQPDAENQYGCSFITLERLRS